MQVKTNKRFEAKDAAGQPNGILVPLYNLHEGFHAPGKEPQQVYMTAVSKGQIKGPHLHFIRTDCFTCNKGKARFVLKTATGYEVVYRSEAHEYRSVIVPSLSATQAKLAKAMPQRFEVLSQYDFLFYTDDRYKLQQTILPVLAASMRANRSPMTIKLHPWLKPNLLPEYTGCLFQKRYLHQRGIMIEYISSQLMAGLKVQTDRHITTNCILRDMRHPEIATLNETWCQHIKACGIECQVSFFFVARMFKNISILPDHRELCV